MGEKEELLSIRRAELCDVELLHRMAWEVFPHTYKDILTAEQIEYMMHWMYDVDSLRAQMGEKGHEYFVAYVGNVPAGYISIRPESIDCFHLEKIYVLPEFQHKHYGRTMFIYAIDYIRANKPGVKAVELNVNRNNPAVTFYYKMGMRVVRQGDFEIGHDFYMNDYIMRLDIRE